MPVDRFPVEEGAILLFARALGDPNMVYQDHDLAPRSEVGGVIAPPTFVQSSAQFDDEYVLRPVHGTPWFGSGRTASGCAPPGGGGTVLHAEQHFEYHRPLRPGDVLSATTHDGERWEKQGRSGKLVFSETITEFRDPSGELCVTVRAVGVETQKDADEEAAR